MRWGVKSASCLCLLAASLWATPGSAASVEDWRHDIDSIVKDLQATHPDPFTKTGKTTFLREAAAFEQALPNLSDHQRLVHAMHLVGLVQDNHTWLEPNNKADALWYPIRMVIFADGVFVTGAHKSVSELAGAEVLQIAGRPPLEVLKTASALMGCDNDFAQLLQIYPAHNAAIMKGLGYADAEGRLSLKLKLASGKIEMRILAPVQGDDSTLEWRGRPEMAGPFVGPRTDWIGAFHNLPASSFSTPDATRPLYFQDRGANFYSHALPDRDAYYIQVVWMHDSDTEGLVQFFQRSMKEVDEHKPKNLIVDLRHEGGGDGSKADEIIEEFVKRKDAQPWKRLYVLTGPACYSACNILLAKFLEFTDVTVIGEPEGAPQNSFGDSDIGLFNYPKTGLRMFVSTVWHQLGQPNDVTPYTPVDIPVPDMFHDYAEGRDAAIDPILAGAEMRSISSIVRAEGGAAARVAFDNRKARFSKFSWWTPARESELNDIGHDYLHRKKYADAIAVFQLATEIFPYSWNTWDSLGEGQATAGDKADAAKNYKHALDIDPNDVWAQDYLRTGKVD